jgi:hypothetical protein
MSMSLRGRQPEAIPCLMGFAQYQQDDLSGVAGIASSRRTRALLAMTWAMKALDDESAKILKSIEKML